MPARFDYLVTGGAGFIGSHLCERLQSEGKSVCVLDDLSTGHLENIKELQSSDNFHFIEGSVLSVETVNDCVDMCEEVIHLAAAVGVENVIKRPVETIETNVSGTENVLRAARKNNTKVFIASTSEVYGKSWKVPFKEDGDIVLGPTSRNRWSYACSKALDEFLALAYNHSYGLPVVICRFFNTVGPRQSGRYGMVLPRFINQALTGQPITVFGNGTQTRCFSLVSEVIDCLLALMDSPDAVGKVINVGSTEEITILELARRVREISGSNSEIVLVPYEKAYPPGFEDMQRRVPDISKLIGLIGICPEAAIDTIIRKVIEYGIPEGAQ
ncbi:MAG: NAD-dependent epimerase/dehydratase family protein [Candidatus Sabulitectum sp.]|nr:NAD-dependent epimerase/dehydratase family protein [Candidatus Sabulitectum sp.]